MQISHLLTFLLFVIYLIFFGWSAIANESFIHFYHQLWYPRIWSIGACVLNIIPFPSIYLVGSLLSLWLMVGIYIAIFRNVLSGLKIVLTCLVFTFCSFYVCWGYNYQMPSFVDRIEMDVEVPPDMWISDHLHSQSIIMTNLRSQFELLEEIDYPELQQTLESDIHRYLSLLNEDFGLKEFAYPHVSGMKVQPLPPGSLLRLETSGVYLSQTFQGHIDSGLSSVQIPFTMAHEMLHGYGITEESDCNLLAYLSCRRSNDPWIAYSAEVAFFRYLAFDQIALDREQYFRFRDSLDSSVKSDLDDINRCLRRYPPILGPLKDKIYGAYLRSNGISDGLSNYSYFVKVLYTMEAQSY